MSAIKRKRTTVRIADTKVKPRQIEVLVILLHKETNTDKQTVEGDMTKNKMDCKENTKKFDSCARIANPIIIYNFI